ncbi:MAG TPA: ABC transporter ATP-binding protein [Gammaproteobacteria bacterium]
MSNAPVIRLEQVDRIFQVGDQQVHALSAVTLDIAQGDYLSLMGPSGSGKSTLLHIIGLLDRPSSGHYLLEGKETTRYSDNEQARLRRDHIGFVFQFFHLVPRLTAAQNIELPLVLAGVPPEERAPRVERVLQAFGIAERAQHRPDQLSGGQRQRVAIGRAMVSEPKVLLADEPTGNLDRASGHEVIALLEELNARGITLIVVTHDPELGRRARRQLQMVDGRIISDTPGAR